jgi:hypothetical protein
MKSASAIPLVAVALLVLTTSANSQTCQPGYAIRMNSKGQPQCANVRRTWADCVQAGISLGYPRKGAEDYCLKRGARPP